MDIYDFSLGTFNFHSYYDPLQNDCKKKNIIIETKLDDIYYVGQYTDLFKTLEDLENQIKNLINYKVVKTFTPDKRFITNPNNINLNTIKYEYYLDIKNLDDGKEVITLKSDFGYTAYKMQLALKEKQLVLEKNMELIESLFWNPDTPNGYAKQLCNKYN